MLSRIRVTRGRVHKQQGRPGRWLGRTVALPCAGMMLFWLVSLSIVSGMDDSMLEVLGADGRAEGAAVQAAPTRSYQTIHRLLSLDEPWVAQAYWLSVRMSLATALAGGSLSVLLIYGIAHTPGRSIVRGVLLSCDRGAHHLWAVPLAFASPAVFGHSGLVAVVLDRLLSTSLIRDGITPGSVGRLILTYAVLQIPLLLLVIAPVLVDLPPTSRAGSPRRDVRGTQYWYSGVLPRLTPVLLATTILLFANSLGAQVATCAESGCERSSLPYLLVDEQRRGDVPVSQVLGYALSVRMALTMAFGLVTCAWIHTMSEAGKESLTLFVTTVVRKVVRSLTGLLR